MQIGAASHTELPRATRVTGERPMAWASKAVASGAGSASIFSLPSQRRAHRVVPAAFLVLAESSDTKGPALLGAKRALDGVAGGGSPHRSHSKREAPALGSRACPAVMPTDRRSSEKHLEPGQQVGFQMQPHGHVVANLQLRNAAAGKVLDLKGDQKLVVEPDAPPEVLLSLSDQASKRYNQLTGSTSNVPRSVRQYH